MHIVHSAKNDVSSQRSFNKGSDGRQSFFFQPKLSINQPNDVYEQDADAVADKIMRIPDTSLNNNVFFKPAFNSIQKKCAHCEEEEEKKVQRKQNDNVIPQVSDQTESYISALSGGKPLSNRERNLFEPAMGYNFSGVRLHTDSIAAKSAQAINALAYTSGNNIVFNSGQYNAETAEGKRLLAHELTHVVQQNTPGVIQRQKPPSPTPPVPAAPPPTTTAIPSEFTITDTSTRPDSHTIFFGRGADTLDADSSTKIMFLAGPPTPIAGNIELKGYVSEDEASALAQQRITTVKNEFNSYTGFHGTFTETPQPSAGSGRIDYRHVRAVEIIEPTGHSTVPNCGTTSSRIVCAATTENNFQHALIEARRKITAAENLLNASPRTASTNTLLDRFFGRGVPGNGAAVLSTLLANMGLIRQQIWRVRTASHHPCANVCDGSCAAGAIAYNQDTGSAATYTICPPFDAIDEPNRIRNIIHECAHGTPGLSRGSGPLVDGTDDFAYRHERLINVLDPAVALTNSDSYSLLIMFLNDPAFVTQQPANDDLSAITNTGEQTHVQLAIANLEKWLTFGQQETGSLYDVIKHSKPPATAWSNTYYETTMTIWASNFSQLTTPPALPSDNDQMIVAGIHDRVNLMKQNAKADLVFTRLPANMLWELNLGRNVSVGDDFFAAATPDAKALVFLAAIVHSNIEIPTASERGYVDSIDRIRQRH